VSKRAPLSFTVNPVAPAPAVTEPTGLTANAQTDKAVNAKTRPGRDGRKFIGAHVTPEASKQFNLLAVQQDKTTQDLLCEAINDLFAKNGLSRIA
jgi:hypothetical protein